jgi:nucleoside-diphosphate-sugar epimerase
VGLVLSSRCTIWWTIANKYIRIKKVKRELDHEPIFGLEEGLRRTIGWYREVGMI